MAYLKTFDRRVEEYCGSLKQVQMPNAPSYSAPINNVKDLTVLEETKRGGWYDKTKVMEMVIETYTTFYERADSPAELDALDESLSETIALINASVSLELLKNNFQQFGGSSRSSRPSSLPSISSREYSVEELEGGERVLRYYPQGREEPPERVMEEAIKREFFDPFEIPGREREPTVRPYEPRDVNLSMIYRNIQNSLASKPLVEHFQKTDLANVYSKLISEGAFEVADRRRGRQAEIVNLSEFRSFTKSQQTAYLLEIYQGSYAQLYEELHNVREGEPQMPNSEQLFRAMEEVLQQEEFSSEEEEEEGLPPPPRRDITLVEEEVRPRRDITEVGESSRPRRDITEVP